MLILDREIDLIERKHLESLFTANSSIRLSIHMPTHRKGRDVREDPIRLKNMLKEAREQLEIYEVPAEHIRSMVAPIERLLDDTDFWQHQGDSLALFSSGSEFETYRLPLEVETLVYAGPRYHTRPLAELFTDNGTFYLLALDQGGIRLFHGTRHTMSEILLPDVSLTLEDFLRYDEEEKALQHHNAQRGPQIGGDAIFHGQGAAGDDARHMQDVQRFLRQVERAVTARLYRHPAPLVLAGGDNLRGLYRKVNRYEYLADGEIRNNPDSMELKELHAHSWAAIEPHFEIRAQEAWGRFEHMRGTDDPRARSSIERLLPAAAERRLDTLFLPPGRLWGQFDPENRQVSVHPRRKPKDEDLLDRLLAETLRYGGTVHTMTGRQPHEVCGILRG